MKVLKNFPSRIKGLILTPEIPLAYEQAAKLLSACVLKQICIKRGHKAALMMVSECLISGVETFVAM